MSRPRDLFYDAQLPTIVHVVLGRLPVLSHCIHDEADNNIKSEREKKCVNQIHDKPEKWPAHSVTNRDANLISAMREVISIIINRGRDKTEFVINNSRTITIKNYLMKII